MPTNIDAIPDALRSAPQWVVWRNDDGRKMPYNAATGRQAQSNNPLTWVPFDDAVATYRKGGYDGLGFMFDADDPYVGVDLDDCIDEAGNIAEWANEIICSFGSYAEISPSGTGVKIWAEGSIPSNIGHTAHETGAIEMYHKLRFFTMTGQYLHVGDDDKPMPLCYVNGPLGALHSSVIASKRGNKPEHKAAPTSAALDTGINEKRLSAYVQRAFEAEIAAVALAPDGHKHDTLRNAAVKVASLFAHGLDEATAFDALYNAIAGRSRNANEAADTIKDGFDFGRDKPRDLAGKFEERQPWFDANGMACCPTHKTTLVRTVKRDAWRCADDFQCFYWTGEGYLPTTAVDGFEDSERIPERAPINFDDDETPALPFEIDYELGRNAGRWLDLYVDYASKVSPMTPVSFHETAALWLVSMAIARRVSVKMSFANIQPNIFMLWVARSTIFSKTTAMGVATRLAGKTFPHLLGPQEMTPEALYADMSGKEPQNIKDFNDTALEMWRAERNFCAQRGFAWDEISGFLAKSQKEYNAGLVEGFLKFYDCDDHKATTKGGGRIWVQNTYVSILGASTPVMMQQHFNNPQLASNGWWQRFIIVTPENEKPEYCEDTDYVSEPPHMQSWLHKIYSRLPMPTYPNPAPALELRLTPDVLRLWKQYDKALRFTLQGELEERFSSTYSRYPTNAIKVATILAVMDWGESAPHPEIKLKHMVRAIEFCEHWRRCLHRVMGASVATQEKTLRDRILRQVGRHDATGGVRMSDLNKLLKDVEFAKLKIAILELVELGDIIETRTQGDGRGRPSLRYRLPRD